MIRLEYGNTVITMSESQMANAIAAMNRAQLQDFTTDLNITVPEILDLIQRDETGQANDLNNLSTLVVERLMNLGNEYKDTAPLPLDSPQIRNDVDAAVLSHNVTAEKRIEHLADIANTMSNTDLEKGLRGIGLLQHSDSLMR